MKVGLFAFLILISSSHADQSFISTVEKSAHFYPADETLKRENAAFYSRNIDRALKVIHSDLRPHEKKIRLEKFIQEARSWKNVKTGEYSKDIQAQLNNYEEWVKGENFWILEAHLVTVKFAVRTFL